METIAQHVSRFDTDVASFLTELGYCLQEYRGPALSDSITHIAAGLGDYGRLFVIELAKQVNQ